MILVLFSPNTNTTPFQYGIAKNVQSHTIQVRPWCSFHSFYPFFGVVEILVVIIHYLLELWIYSLKFERAQSVKFLCPRMSPLYYILDGKAQINSSSLIIYRSQFSLAFSSSCWTKYKLKHYLPLKLPSTVATSQKYHSSKYGKSLSLYHAVLSAYAFKGKFHHIGDNLHLILISDRSSKTAIIDLSCFLPSNEIM